MRIQSSQVAANKAKRDFRLLSIGVQGPLRLLRRPEAQAEAAEAGDGGLVALCAKDVLATDQRDGLTHHRREGESNSGLLKFRRTVRRELGLAVRRR
ncbi:MAG: hypothetical protein ACRBN8_08770 [Nannocystales bacterium]